jgi:hypothetical protein
MALKRLFMPLLALVVMAIGLPLHADPCIIPPDSFCTFTQGGWGGPSNSVPGGIRDANFATCFPGGLTVGGFYTIHLSTASAVQQYLPDGGTPNVLDHNYVNPGGGGTISRNLGAQLTALTLSLQFATCGVPHFHPFGHLLIASGVHSPSGPFAGVTVDSVVTLANIVLGGYTGVLPPGISVSDITDVLDAINNNFDNCNTSRGYLVYPGCDHFLAVEFSAFTATAGDHSILLAWRTASEANIASYEVLRRSHESWETVQIVNGLGDSPTGHTYRYTDYDMTANTTYDYRLIIHETDGSVMTYAPIVSAAYSETSLPTEYALLQNYPNPFNPSTTIAFALPEVASVRLTVFDVTGRAVATLLNGTQSAGSHSVNFDASRLAAGLYFYRLEAPNFSATRKLMLLK